MKKIIICAILVLAMASQADAWGRRGGDAPRSEAVYSGGFQSTGPTNGDNGTPNGPGNPVSVPEPSTLLLLGAGLGAIIGLRKKLKKR